MIANLILNLIKLTMVVFACETCFATLKMQQVDKHCAGKCRDAWGFTCVECGKTFEGYDYKEHK